MTNPTSPPQAFLMLAYGGPEGMDDVWPFLQGVTGGRVPDARLREVAGHYEHFNGVSPLHVLTRQQQTALELVLAKREQPLSGYLGMRFWRPLIKDTLAEMRDAGVHRMLGKMGPAVFAVAAAQISLLINTTIAGWQIGLLYGSIKHRRAPF